MAYHKYQYEEKRWIWMKAFDSFYFEIYEDESFPLRILLISPNPKLPWGPTVVVYFGKDIVRGVLPGELPSAVIERLLSFRVYRHGDLICRHVNCPEDTANAWDDATLISVKALGYRETCFPLLLYFTADSLDFRLCTLVGVWRNLCVFCLD